MSDSHSLTLFNNRHNGTCSKVVYIKSRHQRPHNCKPSPTVHAKQLEKQRRYYYSPHCTPNSKMSATDSWLLLYFKLCAEKIYQQLSKEVYSGYQGYIAQGNSIVLMELKEKKWRKICSYGLGYKTKVTCKFRFSVIRHFSFIAFSITSFFKVIPFRSMRSPVEVMVERTILMTCSMNH